MHSLTPTVFAKGHGYRLEPGTGDRYMSAATRAQHLPPFAGCHRYGGEHRAPELQKEAVYGLTELNRYPLLCNRALTPGLCSLRSQAEGA